MPAQRRTAKEVRIGSIAIGGKQPIAVQGMCSSKTEDVKATLQQIRAMVAAGADVIRVAVPNSKALAALPAIKAECPVPLVADIHFNYRLAIKAADAGVDKLRLNPGNIGKQSHIKQVVERAKEKRIPIRIGINQGSVEKDLVDKYVGPRPEAMVESALRQVSLLERLQFTDIVISLKAASVYDTIRAYELAAAACDYPLHLGVTAAGPLLPGVTKSAIALGILLSRGIGDTLRVSLSADVVEEIKAGWEILRALQLRQIGPEIISCPGCGRTRVDFIPLVAQVEKALANCRKQVKVAVMGCLVNGPGEAAEADIGIIAGPKSFLLIRKGKPNRHLTKEQILPALLQEINTFGH